MAEQDKNQKLYSQALKEQTDKIERITKGLSTFSDSIKRLERETSTYETQQKLVAKGGIEYNKLQEKINETNKKIYQKRVSPQGLLLPVSHPYPAWRNKVIFPSDPP